MTDSLERAIGRLEGKVDMVLANQTTQTATSDDHETRIVKVERWQSKLVGALAVVVFVAGVIAKALW